MNKNILITGGAGFIGINSADYLLAKHRNVIIFDNLSRKGSSYNIKWLKQKWGDRVNFIKGDITTDKRKLASAVNNSDVIIHLAAQVAVTTSVVNPRKDLMINLVGTFNILESIRSSKRKPMLIFSSTNKVYGNIDNIAIKKTRKGYRYKNLSQGVSEDMQLDFHSPYGCSKGAADQYVRDYSRIYGLNTVVFRQSCIYGPHQFGVEDQGWVAWFTISAILNRKITIYGDGYQVRDVLHVDDLSRLYNEAIKKDNKIKGQIYNIGGGNQNVFSILDTIRYLERRLGMKIDYSFSDWRPGDQKVFISDIGKIKEELNWEPRIDINKGLDSLITWVQENRREVQRIV